MYRVWVLEVSDKLSIQIVIEWLYFKSRRYDHTTCWNVYLLSKQLEIPNLCSELAQFILDHIDLLNLPIQSWFVLAETALFDHNSKKMLRLCFKIKEIRQFCSMVGLDPHHSFLEYVFLSQLIFYRTSIEN